MTFKGAIFDLDGTIIDSEPLHLAAVNTVLKPFGISIAKDTWLSLYAGTSNHHVFEDALVKRGLLGRTKTEELLRDVREEYRRLSRLQLVPVKGFAKLYDDVKALRVPRIIATNGDPENVEQALQILKLEEEPWIGARDVGGKVKPDPSIFDLACERLKLSPQECVVFEDSKAGVVAAKRAGCYCVALLTSRDEQTLKDAGADMIIEDFSKVTAGLLFS